ncbi:META domain-containing protein [Thermaurantiacus sp.]
MICHPLLRSLALAALGAVGACAPMSDDVARAAPAATSPPAAPVPAALAGEWAVFELAGAPVTGRVPTIGFREGRVFGFGGCNRYMGPVSFTGADGIKVGAAAMTMMACPAPQMELERRFTAALEGVARWQVADDVLTLLSADGSIIARARPAPKAT